jgi:hypothetical protein
MCWATRAVGPGSHLPICWCQDLSKEWRYLCCAMCLADAPQAHNQAVKAQLLKVHTAGSQRCHQQPVQVLLQCAARDTCRGQGLNMSMVISASPGCVIYRYVSWLVILAHTDLQHSKQAVELAPSSHRLAPSCGSSCCNCLGHTFERCKPAARALNASLARTAHSATHTSISLHAADMHAFSELLLTQQLSLSVELDQTS